MSDLMRYVGEPKPVETLFIYSGDVCHVKWDAKYSFHFYNNLMLHVHRDRDGEKFVIGYDSFAEAIRDWELA